MTTSSTAGFSSVLGFVAAPPSARTITCSTAAAHRRTSRIRLGRRSIFASIRMMMILQQLQSPILLLVRTRSSSSSSSVPSFKWHAAARRSCEAFSIRGVWSTPTSSSTRGTILGKPSHWARSFVKLPVGVKSHHRPVIQPMVSHQQIHRRWASSRATSQLVVNGETAVRLSSRQEEEESQCSEKANDPALVAAVPPLANGSLASNNDNDSGSPSTDNNDPNLEAIQRLTETWRENPMCNPTIHCKTWIPTDQKMIQTILHSELTKPYLASRVPLWQHLHHGEKLVRHLDSSRQRKVILLHPDTPSLSDLPEPVRELLRWTTTTPNNDDSKDDNDNLPRVTEGPTIPIKFTYNQFTAKYLLEQLLPNAAHPPPSSFEAIGHVAHLNLHPRHVPYRHLIGQVLVATLPDTIGTVVHKVGAVQGPHRTYALEVMAGRHDTVVQLQENGISLQFDLATVYWCSRLSNERQRLLRDEILVNNNNNNNNSTTILADPFCGVGALCLQAARDDVQVWANDWNPHAIQALRHNAAQNGLTGRVSRMECGDAYDFLMDLGLAATTTSPKSDYSSTTTSREPPRRLPDHVVMNFPLRAPEFLGALRWWPATGTVVPRVHVYTFARDAVDSTTTRSARDVAVDLVAHQLIPPVLVPEQLPSLTRPSRLQELNDEYECQVRVHHVRDVAPGKLVYCVSFSATPKLLRCMQGDFV